MEYIKIDLSFVPPYDFPEDLAEFDGQAVIMPYTEPKIKYSFDDLALMKKELECARRYYDFEYAISKYAHERLDLGDLSLAEKCFRYLVEMGCIQAEVFDRMIDIYYMQNDQISIRWISEKIKKALTLSFDYNNQKKKLTILLDKVG